jgi:hypothetical protein
MSKLRVVAAQASVFALVLLAGTAAFAQGTSLSVVVSAEAAACVNGISAVTVNYTVTSTGAADAATVGYSVNLGSSVPLPTIASGVAPIGGWTQGIGRNKTATGQFVLNLSNGEYDIEVCAAQNGTDAKSDCNSVHVQVLCTEVEACDQSAVLFGEVAGNKNLCKSDARINVQLKGLFGPTAGLEVKNELGDVVQTVSTDRAGDSCVYHWNVNPKDWSSMTPGLYTFKVTGQNGATYSFSAPLVCSVPGKK